MTSLLIHGNTEYAKIEYDAYQHKDYPNTLKLMQQFMTSRFVEAVDLTKPVQAIVIQHDGTTRKVEESFAKTLNPSRVVFPLDQMYAEQNALETFLKLLNTSLDLRALQSAYKELPPSIRELLNYFVWYDHDCPQIDNYGEKTVLSDPKILLEITHHYIHPDGPNLIEQLVRSARDKTSMVQTKHNIHYLEEYKKNASDPSQPIAHLNFLLSKLPWSMQCQFHDAAGGKDAVEENPRILMHIMHTHEKSLLDHTLEEQKSILLSSLQNQKYVQGRLFTCLLDENKMTHRQLHKVYKSLDADVQERITEKPPYFGQGIKSELHKTFGSHILGDGRVAFQVYAPNAQAVSVAIREDGKVVQSLPMESIGKGIWRLETSEATEGTAYHYHILSQEGKMLRKTDPYGQYQKDAPYSDIGTDYLHESIVVRTDFAWDDHDWTTKQKTNAGETEPKHMYELNVENWKKKYGHTLDWRTLAKEVIAECRERGYTHVELYSVMNHTTRMPFGGYQPSSFFAPNSKLGAPQEFKAFINELHKAGIGIVLDWVPGHFAIDDFALAKFDGSPVFEHPDTRRALHPEWGVISFDFEQKKVTDFLLSSARAWLEEYHIDGLRVDGLTSMYFTNYSRSESLPHHKGGGWHLDALNMLRELSTLVHTEFPGKEIDAEESSGALPVTLSPKDRLHNGRLSEAGPRRALGFDAVWKMGWTVKMIRTQGGSTGFLTFDPAHRGLDNGRKLLLDSIHDRRGEKVVLPVSHDETASGKMALIHHMYRESYESNTPAPSQWADLRCFRLQQMTLPGSKLTHMGDDFAQTEEWSYRVNRSLGIKPLPSGKPEPLISAVNWEEAKQEPHAVYQGMVKELNHLYLRERALWGRDDSSMQMIYSCEGGLPILAYIRKSEDNEEQLICIQNFGLDHYEEFVFPLPQDGSNPKLSSLQWLNECFSTDDARCWGTGRTNEGRRIDIFRDAGGNPTGFKLRLAPQTGIILKAGFRT